MRSSDSETCHWPRWPASYTAATSGVRHARSATGSASGARTAGAGRAGSGSNGIGLRAVRDGGGHAGHDGADAVEIGRCSTPGPASARGVVDWVVHRGFNRTGRRPARGAPGRYAPRVAQPSDVEARLAALEARMDIVAADAAAARHLAAARDRDLADLGVKVDANRTAINALGEQTAAGFAEMRGKLDAAAAGQQRIVDLLTGLISGPSDQQ